MNKSIGLQTAESYCHAPQLSDMASCDAATENADRLIDSTRCKTEDKSARTNAARNTADCPYLSKLSEVLFDPTKYAEDNER